jgi:hypothetical protein
VVRERPGRQKGRRKKARQRPHVQPLPTSRTLPADVHLPTFTCPGFCTHTARGQRRNFPFTGIGSASTTRASPPAGLRPLGANAAGAVPTAQRDGTSEYPRPGEARPSWRADGDGAAEGLRAGAGRAAVRRSREWPVRVLRRARRGDEGRGGITEGHYLRRRPSRTGTRAGNFRIGHGPQHCQLCLGPAGAAASGVVDAAPLALHSSTSVT